MDQPDLTDAASRKLYERFGTCCACEGCEEHGHMCTRSPEERAERLRLLNEMRAITMEHGDGHYTLSGGSAFTVRTGPGASG